MQVQICHKLANERTKLCLFCMFKPFSVVFSPKLMQQQIKPGIFRGGENVHLQQTDELKVKLAVIPCED